MEYTFKVIKPKMTGNTAKSLWRLAKIAIMYMIVCGRPDSKELSNKGTYSLLKRNGSYNVISKRKHEDHERKRARKRTRCPHGHVPVLVGEEGKRYFVTIAYLCHQVFTLLLERTRLESGYKHDFQGGILVMCDVQVFEHLIHLIQNSPASQSMDVVTQDVLYQLAAMECSGPLIIE